MAESALDSSEFQNHGVIKEDRFAGQRR
jgi:hypothetical protein